MVLIPEFCKENQHVECAVVTDFANIHKAVFQKPH